MLFRSEVDSLISNDPLGRYGTTDLTATLSAVKSGSLCSSKGVGTQIMTISELETAAKSEEKVSEPELIDSLEQELGNLL